MGHKFSTFFDHVGHEFEVGWHKTEEGVQDAYNEIKDPLKDLKRV